MVVVVVVSACGRETERDKTSRQAEKHVDDMLAGKIQPEVPVVNFPFGGHSEDSKNN